MSVPKMVGPGSSAASCSWRDPRGWHIQQSGLTTASKAQIRQDPFKILPEYRLARIIVQLSGNSVAAGKASTRLKENRLLFHARREPVFHRIIVKALQDNPKAVPAIRDAILQNNPDLFPAAKRRIHQACRQLAELVRPQIQAAKDKNLINFFAHLMKSLNNLPDLPNYSLSAEAIRKWMNKNQASLYSYTQLHIMDADLEFIPQELCNFVNLTHLKLSGNKLSNLPDSFGNLKQLTDLSLGKNKFTKFPEILLELERLGLLYFEDNMLESIPETLAAKLPRMRGLQFMGNRLTTLPRNMFALRELHTLGLSRNLNFNQSFPYYNIRWLNDGRVQSVKYNFSTPRRQPLHIILWDTAIARRIEQARQTSD